MATMTRKQTVDVHGDRIEITWDGNVWISPHNGQQHSRAESAMRSELEQYFRDCGENIEDDETVERIDRCLSRMTDED